MLSVLNNYQHGYVAIPVIISCRKHNLFKILNLSTPLHFNDISQKLQANSGHLRTALHMLESLNWVYRNDMDEYLLKQESDIHRKIPEDIIKLLSFPMDDYLGKNQKKHSLKKWIEMSQKRWSIDDTMFANFLDGMLVIPLVLALKGNNLLNIQGNTQATLFPTLSPSVRNEVIKFFTDRGWLTQEGGTYVFTDAGRFITERILNTGVVASYRPMLANISEVIFGNCMAVFSRDEAGHELHIDRNLNVRESGFQHEKYFSDVEKIVLSIFDRKPFSEQPKYIADMVCGDGTLLKKIYEVIKNKSSRGKVLNEYPIKLIGIDFNEKALIETALKLKNIDHMLLKGDIADPEQVIIDLKDCGIQDTENILHIRSFIDYDRPNFSPKDIDAVNARINVPSQDVFVSGEGKEMPAASVMQSLVEHFGRWSKVLSKHGCILLEVHSLKPPIVSKFIDKCENLHFDAIHRFSQQQLVEADAFLIAAAEAGLFPKQDFFRKYPKMLPFGRITLNYFKRRDYSVRYAQKSDLPILVELEKQCWDHDLNMPLSVLENRITQYPQGQLVLEMDGKVVGVVYSQRIDNIEELKSVNFETVGKLHKKDGAIIQLLALNVFPNLQHRRLGDQLLEFMLERCSLVSDVHTVVGVTRCKNYDRYFHVSPQEYTKLRNSNGRLVDTVLRMHEIHGAEIIEAIADYRPQDKKNKGYGVLVKYDIFNRKRNDIQVKNETLETHVEAEEAGRVENSDKVRGIRDFILKTVARILGVANREDIQLECPLMEMGLDSADLLEFNEQISQKYRIPLEPTFFFKYNTIAKIISYLQECTSLLDKVQAALIRTLSKILKVEAEDIDTDSELKEYGFDSYMYTEFSKKLNDEYKLELAPAIFIEYPTLRSFAGYLVEEYQTVLAAQFTAQTRVEAPVKVIEANGAEKSTLDEKQCSCPAGTSVLYSPKPGASGRELIAIVGISGIFPKARDVNEFWRNLSEGRDCISEIPKGRWDWREYYGDPVKEANKTNIKWGGFIDGIDEFDPQFFGISPKEAMLMDPQQRLMMTYVWKAIEDAGYSAQSLSGTKTGIFVGTVGNGYTSLLSQANVTIEGYSSTSMFPSIGPNRMSYFLNIHGPSEPIETSCSSSLVALHRAVNAIESGNCEMAIAGGINTILTPELQISFSKAGMLCEDGRCKTFSDKANGYVRGEGAGMVFLKKLKDAEQAGDHIYGVIQSTYENHGGRANSLTAPNPKAQADLLKTAYTRAGIDPRTVTYIEAHGTGTELGDPIEINGLKTAFKELYQATGDTRVASSHCGLGSVKTNVGHLEVAAGIAGVIKVLLQLKHKTLAKTLHCDTVNPYIQLKDSPFYIVQESREWKQLQDASGNNIPRRAGVSSFGFGGVNAHVVIEEYITDSRERPQVQITKQNPAIIVLSAKNEERLKEQAQQLLSVFEEQQLSDLNLADVAYTLQVGRDAMEERLAVIVETVKELHEKLKGFVEGQDGIEGLYRGQVKRNKEMLAIFTADEELQEAVGKWVQRRKYSKLLDLWVKGLVIDWNKLYGDIKPSRISLPTYPFARGRYWVPENKTKSADSSTIKASVLDISNQESISLPPSQFVTEGEQIFLNTAKKSQAVYLSNLSDEQVTSSKLTEQVRQPSTSLSQPVVNDELRTELHEQAALSTESLQEELTASLADVLYMKQSEIGADDVFTNMGLDSVTGVEWIVKINKRYGTTIQATRVYDYPTIREFTGFLKKELAKQGFQASINIGTSSRDKSLLNVPQHSVTLAPPALTGISLSQPASNNEFETVPHTQAFLSIESLQEELIASLADVLYMKRSEIGTDDIFTSMGLDSVTGVEWIVTINKKYGTSIQATRVYDYPTIREFAGFLKKELDKQGYHASINLGASSQAKPLLNGSHQAITLNSESLSFTIPDEVPVFSKQQSTKSITQPKLETVSNLTLAALTAEFGISSPERIADVGTGLSTKQCFTLQPLNQYTGQEEDNNRKSEGEITTQPVVDLKEIEPGIVQLTMQDRVHKNTFSEELILGMVQAFEKIQASSSYKVVVITGYDSYFASGGTKEGLLAIQEGKINFTDMKIFNLALDCKIPVIAAMQGHGIGAGWAMAMFCDFIVMSRESYYTSNYMKYGFTPGAGATLIFPEKFGISLAQEILFTGRQFSGAELEQKGIPFQVLPRKEVLGYAVQLARELAGAPRESLVALKDLMANSLREKISRTHENELKMHKKTFVNQPGVKERIESIFAQSSKSGSETNPSAYSAALKKGAEVAGNIEKEEFPVSSKKNTDTLRVQDLDNSIAIIGMSGQFPKSSTLDEFWDNLAHGKNCISEIPATRWSIDKYYDEDSKVPGKTNSKWMGVLDDVDKFDPLFFNISPIEAELMDPQQRLFLENCWRCIENSGMNPSSLSGSRCGVFVGCITNDYGQLITEQQLNAHVHMGGSISILSARISYLLNLKGPCLAIDTACSSSLVALAEACNSLMLQTSDLALAGGVNVLVGPSMHIMTTKAGMLSKDGKCYTFDNRANGFVPGEGVGAVLLKRLSDAIRDKDPIYGVIRGWGINQDGKTNGITAPSVNSQILLEKEVYQRFGINPEAISFVEAHGTGTKLGDPIEVEALTEAFRSFTSKKNYCALGSVKSNIGHLLAAAGISGVIKVLLALKHRMLPPTIHFETLNKHISLDDSPFFINDKLQPWETVSGIPRCAAVSSFGFSGTNAHIIIEEYAPKTESVKTPVISNSNKPILFVLSAKAEEQLKTYAECIKSFIESQEDLNLADVAYTLQTGREAMECRLAFMADSRGDLIKTLEKFINNNLSAEILLGQVKKLKNGDVFPGSDEDVKNFTEGRNLRRAAELWVKGASVEWDKLYVDIKPKRIHLPGYTFTKERYWVPEVKATAADSSTTAASGLNKAIHPLLQQNTSDILEQRFSSNFTGEEFFLKDHKVMGRSIMAGAACLEMVRAAVEQAARNIREDKNGVLIKNVVWTRPIAAEDRTTQVHIGLYLEDNREISFKIYSGSEKDDSGTVVYSQGSVVMSRLEKAAVLDIKALQGECSRNTISSSRCYDAFKEIGIEYGHGLRGIEKLYVGAGKALAKLSLPSSISGTMEQFVLHPSLIDSAVQACIGLIMEAGNRKPLLGFALQKLEIFGECTPAMWSYVRYSEGNKAGDRVQKLDIDLCDESGKVCVRMKEFALRLMEGDNQTENAAARKHNTSTEELVGTSILIPVWDVTAFEKVENFPAPEEKVVIAGGTEKDREAVLQVYPKASLLKVRRRDSVEEIVEILEAQGSFHHIVWIASNFTGESIADDTLIRNREHDMLQYFRIIKALLRLGYGSRSLGWSVVTLQGQSISKGDPVNPYHAGIHGLIGSMAREYPNWKIRLVDLEAGCKWPVADIFTLPADSRGDAWAYRGKEWYRQRLVPVHPNRPDKSLYRRGGVYVVIGGAGGIGKVWTEYMIRTYQAQVVWIGRREKDADIQAKLDSLSALGPTPYYIAADATDYKALQKAYKEVKQRYSQIHGVINTAVGTLDHSIEKMEEERFRDGLSAKVDVSVRIAQVFNKETLDFVMFFSSLGAFSKDHGKSSYVASCNFMDAFAHRLSQEWACAVKVMNWGYWEGVGIANAVPEAFKNRLEQTGMGSIKPDEAMEALETLLSGSAVQIALIETTKPDALERMLNVEPVTVYPEKYSSDIENIMKQVKSKLQRLNTREQKGETAND